MKETPEQIYERRKREMEAIMAEELGRLRTCPECGTSFWALRQDQTSCGATCRVRAWRKKDPFYNAKRRPKDRARYERREKLKVADEINIYWDEQKGGRIVSAGE